jgi:hypothetical protein
MSSRSSSKNGRWRGVRPRTSSGSKVMEFGEHSTEQTKFADPLLWNVDVGFAP